MSIIEKNNIEYIGTEYVGNLFMHAYKIGEIKFYSTYRLTLRVWNDVDYCDFSEEEISNNYIYVYRVDSVNKFHQWRDNVRLSIICTRDGNPKPETPIEDLPLHCRLVIYELDR